MENNIFEEFECDFFSQPAWSGHEYAVDYMKRYYDFVVENYPEGNEALVKAYNNVSQLIEEVFNLPYKERFKFYKTISDADSKFIDALFYSMKKLH